MVEVINTNNKQNDSDLNYDFINPSHYKQNGRKECIEEMEDTFGTEAVIAFCECNTFKYLYRAGSKIHESYDRDVQKATWYKNKAEELKNKLKLADSDLGNL